MQNSIPQKSVIVEEGEGCDCISHNLTLFRFLCLGGIKTNRKLCWRRTIKIGESKETLVNVVDALVQDSTGADIQ